MDHTLQGQVFKCLVQPADQEAVMSSRWPLPTEWRGWLIHLGNSWQPVITRQNTREEEGCRENSRDLQRGPPQVYSWIHVSEEITWGYGENPLEKGTAIHSSILAWRILMDREAWRATVQGVTKSQTWISSYHTHTRKESPRGIRGNNSECSLRTRGHSCPQGLRWKIVIIHREVGRILKDSDQKMALVHSVFRPHQVQPIQVTWLCTIIKLHSIYRNTKISSTQQGKIHSR